MNMTSEGTRGNLEARALAQFDALVKKGEIFWAPTDEIKVEQYPFDIYFRISPITAIKPYNPNTQSRRPGFQDDDPDFTLCTIAHTHKLILNKYCWLRPQLILHTLDFQSQRDLLSRADFEASWDVLREMGDKYMIVFNGGPDAGSSVAHKHLQIFPRPEWKTIADRIAEGSFAQDTLPFTYRQISLSTTTTAKELHEHYTEICGDLHISNNVAHSLMLTSSWLVIIPRKCASIRGQIDDALMQGGANAMIGMEWLKKEEQFRNWVAYGPMRVLVEFGVVPDAAAVVAADSEQGSPSC